MLFLKTRLKAIWKLVLATIVSNALVTVAMAQQWDFVEDFSTDTNKGAATTANWDTATGVLKHGLAQPLASPNVMRLPMGGVGVEDLQDSRGIALGDFDGDGDLDAVVGNEGAGARNIIYRNVDGAYEFASFTIGSAADLYQTLDIATGDIDNDGDLDIVAGNYGDSAYYYLNDGTATLDAGNFPAEVALNPETLRTWAIGLADFDNDGDLDYVEANSGSSSQSGQINGLYLNRLVETNTLSFSAVQEFTNSADRARSRALAIGDTDNDGDLDIVFGDQPIPGGHPGNNTCHSWTGSGFGGANAIQPTSAFMTFAVKLADVNGDGYLDLIEGSQGEPTYVYMNSANGSPCAFDAPIVIGDSNALHTTVALEVGDFDRDGDIDIVEGNNGDWDDDGDPNNDRVPQPVRLFLNNGNGTFANGIDTIPPKQKIYGMDVGHVDDDGQLDLVSASSDEEQPANDPIPVTGGNAVYYTLGTPSGAAVQQVASIAVSTEDVDVNPNNRNIESAGLSFSLIQPTQHTTLKYYLSNDNGSSWININPKRAVAFPRTGQQLMWAVVMESLSPVTAQHPQLDSVRIEDNQPPRFTPSNNDAGNPIEIQAGVGEDVSVSMTTYFDDPQGQQMTFIGTSVPASLSLNSRSGELSGAPTALDLAASPIDFTVVASDGLESRTGYFRLVVGGGSNTPVAADDGPYDIAEGATLNDGSSVLDNDTDPNGDPLTAVLESGPASASSFTLNADGTFVYVHDGVSAAATDSFTYRASDGTLQSNVATVTINITVVDDPPVITLMGNATMALTEGDTYTDPGYTATDDEDGDITANVVVGGDAVDTGTAGTYVVTYNVTDSGGNAATEVTRTVTVSAAPPPPPPPPPPPSGGGGGFTGLWEMIALIAGGLISLARRRRKLPL